MSKYNTGKTFKKRQKKATTAQNYRIRATKLQVKRLMTGLL